MEWTHTWWGKPQITVNLSVSLYLLTTKICHWPSAFTRIRLVATVAADIQHPLKGVQGRDQKWGALCSGENWQNRSSDRYFQEKRFHEPNSCISYLACMHAKSLWLCPTLCDPLDGTPPGSSVPGILQARILEWIAISFSNACKHAKTLQPCPTRCNPLDGSPPGSLVPEILQARILEWVAISFSSFI